jgi:hypothetical protein
MHLVYCSSSELSESEIDTSGGGNLSEDTGDGGVRGVSGEEIGILIEWRSRARYRKGYVDCTFG